jgi:hypothetical protein
MKHLKSGVVMAKNPISQTYNGVRQRSVLSPLLFNIIMDEIIRRVTKGQESGIPKIMVHKHITVIWESKESSLEKKFQRVVTVCKYFRLNANLYKCVVMKRSSKTEAWKSQNIIIMK